MPDTETSVCPREQLIPMRYIDDDGNATETPGNPRVFFSLFCRVRRDLADTKRSIRQFAMNVAITFLLCVFLAKKNPIIANKQLITKNKAGSPNVPLEFPANRATQKITFFQKIVYFRSVIHGGAPIPVINGGLAPSVYIYIFF